MDICQRTCFQYRRWSAKIAQFPCITAWRNANIFQECFIDGFKARTSYHFDQDHRHTSLLILPRKLPGLQHISCQYSTGSFQQLFQLWKVFQRPPSYSSFQNKSPLLRPTLLQYFTIMTSPAPPLLGPSFPMRCCWFKLGTFPIRTSLLLIPPPMTVLFLWKSTFLTDVPSLF